MINKTTINTLARELNRLKNSGTKYRKQINAKPEYRCRLRECKGGYPALYLESGSKKDGTYRQAYVSLRSEAAGKLVTSDYCTKLVNLIDEEIEALESFLGKYRPEKKFDLIKDYHPTLHKHLEGLLISPEAFARDWEEQDYPHFEGRPEARIYPTKKGDLVRSKSEAMIADLFYDLKLPYRYEPMLVIDGEAFYPDFTLLNPFEGMVFIVEHFGRMGETEYSNRAVMKIRRYCSNRNTESLIWFFETSDVPLDIKMVENVIFDRLRLEDYGVERIYKQ